MIFEESMLFRAWTNGHHIYRIPAMAMTPQGTIPAFWKGREHGAGDAGEIDLLLKRSFDNGVIWENAQLIVDEGRNTAGNSTPVAEVQTRSIWQLVCTNLGDGGWST